MARPSKKITRRLAERLAAWDALPGGAGLHGGSVKIVNGETHRRPGSLSGRK